MTRASSARIPELDGVRGLAIAMVVVYHLFGGKLGPGLLPQLTMIPMRIMWTGVDLFFVLSGCLIGGILMDHRDAANYYPVFYARRTLRIFPLYFVWIAIFLAATAALSPQEGSILRTTFSPALPGWSYLTFTQNFQAAWKHDWGGGWAAPTWSLAVEEQFYLTLPLFVRHVSRKTLIRAALAAIAAALLFRALFYMNIGPEAPRLLLPGRIDEFGEGLLVAAVMRDARASALLRQNRRWVLAIMLAVAAVVAHATLTDFSSKAFMEIAIPGLMGIFYALLLGAVLVIRPAWTGVLRTRWLCALGVIAYGVYVMHQGLDDLAHVVIRGAFPRADSAESMLVTIAALGLTLALASASWRFFESPLTDWGRRHFRYSSAASPVNEKSAVAWIASRPAILASDTSAKEF